MIGRQQDDARDLDWRVFGHGEGERYEGTRGNDRIVGTDSDDIFRVRQGGMDHIHAGGGQDRIYFGASFTADDRVNGGKAYDTVVLEGDYSQGLTIETDTLSRVETLELRGDYDYRIVLPSNMQQDKASFSVSAVDARSLYIDASAMTSLTIMTGSAGADVMIVGNAGAGIIGRGGGDLLESNGGQTTFVYIDVSDSYGDNTDLITDFGDDDFIQLTNVDANSKAPGNQAFHFGATAAHVGDVTVTYDAGTDVTFVNAFTDKDDQPDMVIQLLGDHRDLTAADFFL